MSSSRSRLVPIVALVSLLSCSDEDSPLEPVALDPTAVGFTEAVPEPPGGVPGFHFTPPIAAASQEAVEPDATLLDLLAVEICEWSGTACTGPAIRRFTAEDRGSARLHVTEDGVYRTVWRSAEDDLDPSRWYRIRVLASGGELGHADVDVTLADESVGSGAEYVQLVRGAALPIGFVIAQGVGERVGKDGGVVELAGGAVTLNVPAGALSGDVLLTAVPVTDLPPTDPPIVPGTAWDFGPDGITFAQPVFMTIAYDPADIPPGVDESELRIHKVVNGAFEQQDAGLVDLVEHTVSAEVDGFSVFVVIERDPENPEDIVAPVVRGVEVFDAASGAFASTTTLNVSASDAALTMRVTITDNITGVLFIDIRYRSPTGRQLRFPCYTGAPPTSGSDTNGEWICESAIPQYSEAGTWQADLLFIRDRINNSAFYTRTAGGVCNSGTGDCVADAATIDVVSATPDLTPPVLQEMSASLDVQPRMFGSQVTVDASTGPRTVIFGLRMTDDLSGADNHLPFDHFDFDFAGPSGQLQRYYGACVRTQGTPLDGFWECRVTVPGQAEPGTWRITHLRAGDRVGNGGFSFNSFFSPNGAGQLCNQTGNCVDEAVIEVTSAGDGTPPVLGSVAIAESGPDVTTTLGIVDDLSGVSFVRIQYISATTSQFQECFGQLATGVDTDGTWSCTISFSQFAARGPWSLRVQLFDRAGNSRWYTRRNSDGWLCYSDPATGEVCQGFGDTDIILL